MKNLMLVGLIVFTAGCKPEHTPTPNKTVVVTDGGTSFDSLTEDQQVGLLVEKFSYQELSEMYSNIVVGDNRPESQRNNRLLSKAKYKKLQQQTDLSKSDRVNETLRNLKIPSSSNH